jgi:hypothetical protein
VLALKTVTFIYSTPEDRIVAAINAGLPETWSCWLTRRLALALLERAADFVASKSALAQQAPAELRGDLVAFERDVAIASTAKAMSKTPDEILRSSVATAELADRVTIAIRGEKFQFELHGKNNAGAMGLVTQAELQRILQMLQSQVIDAGWLGMPAKLQAAASSGPPEQKTVRH